jgi:hypothetical protein
MDSSPLSSCCKKCLTRKNTTYSAKYGHLDCLKYLHENGCTLSYYATRRAAQNGHLDCLKYLHQNGCPWSHYATRWAAKYGHLDCLKYAHQNGCPWDIYTIDSAAKAGHIDCVLYASKYDAPFNIKTAIFIKDNFNIILDSHINASTQTTVDTTPNTSDEKDGNMTITLTFENISSLKTNLDAKNETINTLQNALENEKLKNTKITTALKQVVY